MGSYFFTAPTGCNSSLTILQLIFDMHLFSFAFIVSYIAATQPNCIAIIERSVARLNLIWNKSCNCRCCWTTFFTYCKIKDFSVDNSKVKSLNREVKRLCETERERYSFTLPRGEICKYDHVAGIALMLQMFPNLGFLGCKSSANLNLIGILFAELVKVLVGWVMQH